MKLLAVNGRKWTPELLHEALAASQKSSESLQLIAENKQFIKTYSLDYHGGEKNPHLERIDNQPDLLSDILKPLAK
jgi:hypothetical protein